MLSYWFIVWGNHLSTVGLSLCLSLDSKIIIIASSSGRPFSLGSHGPHGFRHPPPTGPTTAGSQRCCSQLGMAVNVGLTNSISGRLATILARAACADPAVLDRPFRRNRPRRPATVWVGWRSPTTTLNNSPSASCHRLSWHGTLSRED